MEKNFLEASSDPGLLPEGWGALLGKVFTSTSGPVIRAWVENKQEEMRCFNTPGTSSPTAVSCDLNVLCISCFPDPLYRTIVVLMIFGK